MVPFAKLQAAPLAVVAFLAIFFFAWRIHGERFSKTMITMGAGGLIAPAAIGAYSAYNGSPRRRLAFLHPLRITDQRRPHGSPTASCITSSVNRAFAYSIGFLALIACTGVNIRFLRDQIRGEGLWLITSTLLVYRLAPTVYAICKPGNPWGHYLLLGLPAAVFIATAYVRALAYRECMATLMGSIKKRCPTTWCDGLNNVHPYGGGPRHSPIYTGMVLPWRSCGSLCSSPIR